eukprot:439162-Prorocentrum_minimum.AAC.3
MPCGRSQPQAYVYVYVRVGCWGAHPTGRGVVEDPSVNSAKSGVAVVCRMSSSVTHLRVPHLARRCPWNRKPSPASSSGPHPQNRTVRFAMLFHSITSSRPSHPTCAKPNQD